MCGIVGYIGHKSAIDILLNGLTKLEYRGYDSSGIAVEIDGQVKMYKAEGKLQNLKDIINPIKNKVAESTIGIGHIRWATHGAPTTVNAVTPPYTRPFKVPFVYSADVIKNFLNEV